jgi:heme O synthase-like polyprenyltransferase
MMGWAAATGALPPAAWVLGALLFVWQIPHFLALGWLYRDDYSRAGFRVLPVIDSEGRSTRHFALLYSLALLPFALALPLSGLGGWLCMGGTGVAGIGMVAASLCLYREPTAPNARRVFIASLAYLPAVFAVMLLDTLRTLA